MNEPTPHSNIIDRLDKALDNQREIKEHYSKQYWVRLVLIGVSCYILGTNHKNISPYIKGIYDTIINVKKVTNE